MRTEAVGAEPVGAREGSAAAGALCFAGALVELVAAALDGASRDALLRGDVVAAGRCARASGVDRAYLARVVEEQATRATGDPLRPILELVTNAIDASPEGGRVEVSVAPGRVTVSDGGEGMTLEQVATRLVVPFATSRDGEKHLGRRGVGFLSVLGLAGRGPARFALAVDTGDAREGATLRVVAAGPSVRELGATLRRAPGRRGTTVTVEAAGLAAHSVRAYLEDALAMFPPERALVVVDAAAVNAVAPTDAPLGVAHVRGLTGESVARALVGGAPRRPGIASASYHGGLKLTAHGGLSGLAQLDLPRALELADGRVTPKRGPGFDAAAGALLRAALASAAAQAHDEAERSRAAELLGEIALVVLDGAGLTDAGPEIVRALLGPDRHLVPTERAEALRAFLGERATRGVFAPESALAERAYRDLLPGETELLARELLAEPAETLTRAAARRPDLRGLALLRDRSPAAASASVMLVRGVRRDPTAGVVPCLGTRTAVLVREDARCVTHAARWSDVYALRASFDRALGLREHDVERELIVNDPARALAAARRRGGEAA